MADNETPRRGGLQICAGILPVAAGILLFAGFVATPPSIGDGTAGALAGQLAAPGRLQLSSVLLHFGYLLLVPTAICIAWVARVRRVAAGVGAALASLGAGTLAGFVTGDLVELTLARELGPARGAAISEGAYDLWAGPVMAIPGLLGTAVGFAVLGLASWRARALPAWWSVGLVGGLALTMAAGHDRLLLVAGPAVLGASLTYLGMHVLGMPSDEWRREPAPARAR